MSRTMFRACVTTVTPMNKSELALDEASKMRILASQMKQLGLLEVARFLKRNADAAMKWAAKTGGPQC